MMDDVENKDLAMLEQSPLELEIELLQVLAPNTFEKETWELNLQEKWSEARLAKEKGGNYYTEKNYNAALKRYERAIIMMEAIVLSSAMIEAEREIQKKGMLSKCDFKQCSLLADEGIDPMQIYRLLQICRLNYAACCLKLQNHGPVISQCAQVLEKDPKNVKALFRRSQAYTRIGRDLELAEKDLNAAKEIVSQDNNASNGSILQEILLEEKLLVARLKQYHDKEKKMYSSMFSS